MYAAALKQVPAVGKPTNAAITNKTKPCYQQIKANPINLYGATKLVLTNYS